MIGRLKFDISELVEQILDHLPPEIWTSKTTIFLDPAMGGGQFVAAVERRLRSAGHSDKNIAQRVYGFESNQMRVNYAINKHKLVGNYQALDFLETDVTKKIDVILGNPPFQNPNSEASSGKLWPKFIRKGLNLLREDGYIAMITPNSWTKGSIAPRGSGRLWSELNGKDLRVVNNRDCGEYFDQGVSFSYIVARNSAPTGEGLLIQNHQSRRIDFGAVKMLPHDPRAIELVNRFFSGDPIEHVLVTNTRNHNMVLQDSGSIPVYSNGKILYTNSSQYDTEEKILIPWANTYEKHLQVKNAVAGDTTVYCYTNGYGKNWLTVLNSKLYRFCLHQMKMAMHNEPVRSFPKVDFQRPWTDQELYEHFGLTEEEIQYIEETIK